MKKLFTIFAVLMLSAFAANNASAQCCPNPVLTGCFGMCGGEEFHGSVTVTEAGCYTYCITNSLCGSRGIHVKIKAGNKVVAAGLLQNGDSGSFCAEAGQTITIDASPGSADRNINCFVQGEATISVCPSITQ
jgi:hypothetical protein